MSADNWRQCPCCQVRDEEAKANLEMKISEQYGKISIEEFDSLRRQLEEWPELESTLREDYEIGVIDDGEDARFWISYRGECVRGSDVRNRRAESPEPKCGFKLERKVDEKVKL